MIIVDVILPFPINSYFSYIFPYSVNPVIGGRIVVPFRSKDIIGIIISFNKNKDIDYLNLKSVKYIIDNKPICNTALFKTLIWLSKYYYYPLGSVFFLILPNLLKSKNIDIDNQFILIKKKNKYNKHFFLSKNILLNINKILIKNSFSSWLISEVNLYIKIKFYLGLFSKVLKKNLQILIVVPYIKDIYKILFFLKKFFNIDIDIVHSNLSDKKFLDTWIKTRNGSNSIVIGTKKSIFFPFFKLGLIVIFEEQNLIYKNLDKFKCNIRDILIFRAYKENIPIILDSKTPSLKTLYNIIQKKIFWINFYKNNNSLVFNHEIIDLKKEKTRVGLSDRLIDKIFENIEKKFSVLLIFNSSNFTFLGLICPNCKWIPKCSICHDYYEVHKYNNIIFCRYCLINFTKPLFCYNCKFFLLTRFNFGIKKIKKNIRKIFPNIPLLFLINLKEIIKKKIDFNNFNFSIKHFGIIITTEKIVQNYYFPNVRLIGLVNIDHFFNSSNFYNIEYFLQFYFNLINLIQKKSKFLNIFIQTENFNNKELINICNKKYFFCANDMLILRKKFLLPPWNTQVILYCESKNVRQIYIFFKFIRVFLEKKSKKYNISLWFVGPDPIFTTFKKKYFYKLLIQCSSRIYLYKMLRISLEISRYFSIFHYIKYFIDIDIN